MQNASVEIPFYLFQNIPPENPQDIYRKFQNEPRSMEDYKTKCAEILLYANDLVRENNHLKHRLFETTSVLKRLMACRNARKFVADYLQNAKTEYANNYKYNANQHLDFYYCNIKGIDWRKKYPVLGEETIGLYTKLWEDLDYEVSNPDFGLL